MSDRQTTPSSTSPSPPPSTARGGGLARRFLLLAGIALGSVVLGGMTALALGMRAVAPEIDGLADETPPPSRLFSRPLELGSKAPIDTETLAGYLEALGYRRAEPAGGAPPPRGFFSVVESGVRFTTRTPFHSAAPEAGLPVEIDLESNRIREIRVAGEAVDELRLEPVVVHTFYDDHRVERRESACRGEGGQLPETLARALMAAEDHAFRRHRGVSPTGIARAALRNLDAGEIRQGGSTITQQLARNRFLSHERTWRRKAREALIALELERRYTKDELLCAYADLVYFGVRDGVSIVGVGAAAAGYFGRSVEDLSLAEAATLAGMIAAPARYAPTRDRERSQSRRDWVLSRLHKLGWVGEAEFRQALAEPLVTSTGPRQSGVDARYYADAVRRELEDRYAVRAVETASLRIDGTLDWLDQTRAEEVIRDGAGELAERAGGESDDPLQAALLSIETATGSVLSYVGGRDYRQSQFDRVRQARRQIGSLFKPIVYAAAFAGRVAHPETPLADRPIAIRYGDELWAPRNSLERYRGTVTVRQALEQSINSATVRLAAATGLPAVRWHAASLGLEVGREPAVVLGAAEASPWEMAEVYATFARGGRRLAHTTIAGVATSDGRALEGVPRSSERVLDAETSHLVNTTLQGVLRRGTGGSAQRDGLRDQLAGKTGTSNDRRDSWFVGYSAERLTVVWTGRDGFGETPFTGSTGALPLWTRYMLAVRPQGGFELFDDAELDEELLDFENADLWPRCPDEILHPEFSCARLASEGLGPESGELSPADHVAPPVGRIASRGSRRSSPATAVLAAAGGRRGLDVRWASGTYRPAAAVAPRHRARRGEAGSERAVDREIHRRSDRQSGWRLARGPVPDGGRSAAPAEVEDPGAYRDYLELDRHGRIVERAIEPLPAAGEAR